MKGHKIATALLLLIAVAAMASNASNWDIGKTWTVNFDDPVRVGTTLLPAGDYTVRHIKDGEQHVLVFNAGKKEIVRVNCVMEQLPKKAQETSMIINRNGSGERELAGIAFAGDIYRHDLKP
jgi:hypothetical protein